jgi:nuclear transport factor 2 (NTF2) superfamily protein
LEPHRHGGATREVWAFHGNRIAERFAYEWRDDSRSWFRSYGDEKSEFDEERLTRRRIASINDLPIKEKTQISLATRSPP